MIEPFKKLSFLALALATLAFPSSGSAQEPEPTEQGPTAQVPRNIYSTLIFGKPELIVDGLDAAAEEIGRGGAGAELIDAEANYAARLESIRQYQETINQLQNTGGAWAQELTQELLAMGSLYQQQGIHEEAISAYSRALQVNRINYGLDNQEQVPVVERLIDSHLSLGQWSEADQYHNYLYYTQKKTLGLDDPRMIPALDRLARWNLSVFNMRYGEAVGLRLTTAFYLFSAASQIVSVHFGEQDERFVTYQQDMAATAYLVYSNQGLMAEASRPEYRDIQAMFEDEIGRIDSINRQQGYDEGLRALEKIAEHYAGRGDAPLEHALALVSLADWYLLFERRRAASNHYEEAFNMIAALDDGEQLIQEYFGTVKPLPELSVNIEELTVLASADIARNTTSRTGVVDVQFDVTSYGVVSNLEVLTEVTPENSKVLTALRRKVRDSIFRPIVVDGAPARSSGNHFRYRYWY